MPSTLRTVIATAIVSLYTLTLIIFATVVFVMYNRWMAKLKLGPLVMSGGKLLEMNDRLSHEQLKDWRVIMIVLCVISVLLMLVSTAVKLWRSKGTASNHVNVFIIMTMLVCETGMLVILIFSALEIRRKDYENSTEFHQLLTAETDKTFIKHFYGCSSNLVPHSRKMWRCYTHVFRLLRQMDFVVVWLLFYNLFASVTSIGYFCMVNSTYVMPSNSHMETVYNESHDVFD